MMVSFRRQRGPSFLRHAGALPLALAVCLLSPCAAQAHPVPRDSHDRTIVVQLTPDPLTRTVAVTVRYRLEVDELTVVLEDMLPFRDEVQYDRFKNKPNEFYSEFTRIYGKIFADHLVAQADGKLLEFKCVSRSHRKTDETGQDLGHLRCDFVFEASFPIPRRPGTPQTLTFREGNYELQKGTILLSGYVGPALAILPQRALPAVLLSPDGTWAVMLLAMTAPDAALQAKPPQDYQPGDDDRLRQLTFRFGVELAAVAPHDGDAQAAEKAAAQRHTLLQFERWRQTGIKMVLGTAEGVARKPADDTVSGGSLELFQLFLSSEHGTVVLLLLAALFGAAHALTPGHGKTLVAAYLVGERGTVGHAFILGLVTTLTHTGAVLALAGLMNLWPALAELVANAMGLIAGLILVCFGVWLLLQRLAGRADHFHIGGHGHHHGDHHHHHVAPAAQGSQKLGWYGLIVMGMTGGIIPCWDAIVLLLWAAAMNMLALAVPMLLAFSAGLASVLVLIGVLVVHARQFVDRRWGEGRAVRWLPVLSALFITAMGVLACVHGTQSGGHDHHARNTAAARP
jgi:nickel/cobalt exporter